MLAANDESQNDLAAALNLDSGAISRSMHGKRAWKLEEIEAMAHHFDVDISTFFVEPGELLRSRCFSTAVDQLELFANSAYLAA